MRWLLLLLTACTTAVEPTPTVNVDIFTDLEYRGGYYYMTLHNTERQTITRIGGQITVDNQPQVTEFASWESNLYWTLVWNPTINDYERVVTHNNDNPNYIYVATINHSSYSDKGGYVYTMIGPIYEMRGDTMKVILEALNQRDSIKIILQ